jgi:hypothetical protein
MKSRNPKSLLFVVPIVLGYAIIVLALAYGVIAHVATV